MGIYLFIKLTYQQLATKKYILLMEFFVNTKTLNIQA